MMEVIKGDWANQENLEEIYMLIRDSPFDATVEHYHFKHDSKPELDDPNAKKVSYLSLTIGHLARGSAFKEDTIKLKLSEKKGKYRAHVVTDEPESESDEDLFEHLEKSQPKKKIKL